MSKATIFYILMAVAFVAGMWGVMRLGGRLEAPEDLSGVWKLEPGHSVVNSNDVFAGPVRIYQSGRFFNLKFGSGQHLQLQLAEQQTLPDGSRRWTLAGDAWTLVAEGTNDPKELALRLDGASRHAWEAIRAEQQPLVAAPPDHGPADVTPPMATSNAP